MASYQKSAVHCPILVLLVAFGALALLIPISCSPNSQLIEAARRGETEKVKALLDAEADVNAEGGEYGGWTALKVAAGGGHTETVKVLLEAGADVDAKDNDGMTALMWATEKDHTEIVELLKKAGAKK